MKISILTFHNANNYGALLQCYALSKVLKEKGHTVELLNFIPSKKAAGASIKSIIKRVIFIRRLNNFRKEELPAVTIKYSSLNDLLEKPPKADLFIVGSDQVWNYDITSKHSEIFFFNFLRNETPRMAYAASFGLEKWEVGSKREEIQSYLKKFISIGVREIEGGKILKEQLNSNSHLVLDPTLLLNDYTNLLKSNTGVKDAVVGFKFEKGKEWYDCIKYVASQYGVKALSLNENKKINGIQSVRMPSVKNWLSHLNKASFIITDSYHCMLFSIILKKQFIALPANPKRISRMRSILKILNLDNRYYNSINDIYLDEHWKEEIDYNKVHLKLNELRKESLLFLNSSIGIAKSENSK
ncbi:polysaccharide pyruvyl transferase family protein [uncultured Arcticibacterium sp.]|uniref:polysaccharide pyruvyl transferase family protein n=1 Tax=uncultured Arcticibacterium sp. TaxID=2173042 RepID=UPI0030FC43A2